ncbi:hypothetical protein ACFQH5_03160 [Halomonas salifodinae]|uniref:CHASE2 domain-containing protein n=1 Tax=Halomonas salifodinae TaxID=438745 RepID=A0ABW2ERK9_9GAMM
MVTILLCSMLFQAEYPPAKALLSLYHEQVRCAPEQASVRQPAVEPAQRLNDYFIVDRGVWPVVDGQAGDVEAVVREYVSWGVNPGVLLGDLLDVSRDADRRRWLRDAVSAGGIPVARLDPVEAQAQPELLMAWCALGLCPQVFYLPEGVSPLLDGMLPATYLSAPHFSGQPAWPLPQQVLEIGGRHVIPLLASGDAVRGRVVQLSPVSHGPLEEIELLPLSWRLHGLEYRLDASGELETDWPGRVMLAFYGVSLWFWPFVSQQTFHVIYWLSVDFAWISLVVILLNVFWAVSVLMKRREMKRRLGPGREHESR